MHVKLIVENNMVYEKKLFGKSDKAVGVVIDGILTLDENYGNMLKKKKAKVTVQYSYIAPKNDFRRRF